ncbi:hypothetical protein THAOC_32658 [Thalassiosira oceanica]|uniref:PDZ domain-containing protein n=1 Tax=Thalassiosira oceanica TaxID=159749 RepID=K0R8R0_THAOC|nr:hypothetical protein THAOC_32658 [Thalassiosira oceanica]|eukprot:EJK48534.1 hypothetical protein THAOC_32658 [Thalassiosira oceanica]
MLQLRTRSFETTRPLNLQYTPTLTTTDEESHWDGGTTPLLEMVLATNSLIEGYRYNELSSARPAPFAPRACVHRSGERRSRPKPRGRTTQLEGGHLWTRDILHRLQAREVRRERPMRVDRSERLRAPPRPVQQASDREEDLRRGANRAGLQKEDRGDGQTIVEEEATHHDGESQMSGDVCPLKSSKDECQSDSTCLWTVKCISIPLLTAPQSDAPSSKPPTAMPSGVPAVPTSPEYSNQVTPNGPMDQRSEPDDLDQKELTSPPGRSEGAMSNDFQARQSFEVQASMELKPWDGQWNSRHQKLWRRITQQRVRSRALELIERDDLETYSLLADDVGELSVTITVGSSERGPSSQRRLGFAHTTSLRIDFSTVIEFPFDVVRLGRRGNAVDWVDGTQVTETPVSINKSSLSSHDGNRADKSLTYLIVGIVGGVLVAVAIVTSVVVYIKKRSFRAGHIDVKSVGSIESIKPEESACDRTQSSSPSPDKFELNENSPYFGTVRTTHQCDVSTIGDPYIGEPVSRDPVSDATVAFSEHEVLYGGAHQLSRIVSTTSTGVTSGAFSSGRRIVFRDDEGLEDVWLDPTTGIRPEGNATGCRRVTAVAPPGKIGIFLDGADCAVVSAVANNSPLRKSVAIGDILVEIDGLDVTGMRAKLASQLISSKSKKPRRTLVLMRSNALHAEL